VDLISDGILQQKNASLYFDTDTTDTHIPIESTDIINIYSDVIVDSGALDKMMKHNITVNVFDKYGEYIGAFIPNAPLKASCVTHEQLMVYYNDTQRLQLAKEFVLASIHNENIIIRYYNKQNHNKIYEQMLNHLQYIKSTIKNTDSLDKLLMLEAQARNAYYSCFDLFIKREEFQFETRTRRPPKNMVNALLSFGDTVLYNHIATEVQKTPLDVRIGFLHATSTRLKSLNLDIAEIFKPLIVDRTVFSLINKGEITSQHFLITETGTVYLSAEGKRIFLRAFRNKLDVSLMIKSENMTYRKIIVEEIRRLVRRFRHDEKYKAYRQVR
jgi:CRISPR-associated endonuclease Cas1 subtype I-B